MPDMDKNNSTLLGIDSDDDGLRDDVEIFINYMMRDESYNQVMAMRVLAKSFFKILRNRNSSQEKLIRLYEDKSGDYGCLYSFFKGDIRYGIALTRRLRIKIHNTEERRSAKRRASQGAGTFITDFDDIGRGSCRFNPK